MLTFAINQKTVTVPDGSPELEFSLLQFLRGEGLTGCKPVCGEGGCGACTVVLSRWNHAGGEVVHQSVTACLVPLPFVHQMGITTIEGLSQLSHGKHPISEAFYEMGASQCGYCTPGFIMAFMARLADKSKPQLAELEHVFDGNLCRCTGYRPIMDAAAIFCADSPDVVANSDKGKGWRLRLSECASLDQVFPEQFKVAPSGAVIVGPRSTWHVPISVDDVLEGLRSAAGHARPTRIVAGNTDLGYAD